MTWVCVKRDVAAVESVVEAPLAVHISLNAPLGNSVRAKFPTAPLIQSCARQSELHAICGRLRLFDIDPIVLGFRGSAA